MTWSTVLLIAVVLVMIPFITYLCAKLGTYGVLMGRRHFERDYPKKRKETDGQQTKGT